MKAFFLLLLIWTVGVGAQEIPLTTENLVGKYEFLDIQDDTKTPDDIKERKELMEGLAMILNANGTCTTSFIMDLDGKWTLDAAQKTITVTDRKTNVWHIHSLTKTRAVFSRNQTEFKVVFSRK